MTKIAEIYERYYFCWFYGYHQHKNHVTAITFVFAIEPKLLSESQCVLSRTNSILSEWKYLISVSRVGVHNNKSWLSEMSSSFE